jgi:uncharacterized membrane protein YoaK (UPF0700 family)
MFELQKVFNSDISLNKLLIALIIGFVLGLILRLHYRKFSLSISNKEKFSDLFVFLILSITLIISLIKTSLALSLGLVGALSIVRFRTPIKDPEELVYLFLAIAIGLGLGAEQTLATIVSTFVILIFIISIRMSKRSENKDSMYLSVALTGEHQNLFKDLLEILKNEKFNSNLKRMDITENRSYCIFNIDQIGAEELVSINEKLKSSFQKAEISWIDQGDLPV